MTELHGGGGMAEEEEAWPWGMNMMKATNSSPKMRNKLPTSSSSSSSSSAWRFTTTARSATSSDVHQSSVPLDIPDCSKILKKKPMKKKIMWDDDDDCFKIDGEMVPPHEYLARRPANTQIASFSMCEGIGRTLKGRDLTNLRKAILTKTGFLE